MTYKDLANDARLRLFVLIAAVVAFVSRTIDNVRDRLNGDVDAALAAFDKFDARLDRARMIAVKQTRQFNAAADRYDALAFAAEAKADAAADAAERAARVQARFAKLLD